MKDDEIVLSFSKSYIKDKIPVTGRNGKQFFLYVIEIPEDDDEVHEVARTFTLPVSQVHTDKKRDFIKYAYLKKADPYRVCRIRYDSENRVTRFLEDTKMSGEELVSAFKNYRQRNAKKLEESFTPQDEKGNED